MTPTPQSFTHGWYASFVQHCRHFATLIRLDQALDEEIERHGPRVILRHDVDFDLRAAWELSLLEERLGVHSTYLILVSGHYYNIASPAGRELARGLVTRGFDVGLHFDPAAHPATETVLAEAFESERRFLESVIEAPVRSTSTHNPTAFGSHPAFAGVVNAYDPRWFGPDRYLSDSLRVWRSDPFAFVEAAAARGLTLQLLTHPIHFTETSASYVELMEGVCVRWCALAREYAARHNATYRRESESSGR